MSIQREPIYAALWTLVSADPGNLFITKQRRLLPWANVPAKNQPAMFLSETGGYAGHLGGTRIDYQTNLPVIWTLYADIYIYQYVSNPMIAPGQELNPLIDAVEAALGPNEYVPGMGLVQNLGLPGMVQHARLQGKLQTDEGVLANQALAIMPVEIFCL